MEFISIIRNFPKHCKTAVQNIWRNGVMSVSSIFAVTITLILISIISVVAINIKDMTYDLENSLSIYVKIDRKLDDEKAKKIQEEIDAIPGVASSEFFTKEQELDKLIEKQTQEDSKKLFEIYRKNNPMGAAYVVEVKDKAQINEIANQIELLDNVKEAYGGGESSATFVESLETVRTTGTIFVVALAIVALFMIANTIKMTITSRQTEISIMRMVGASNWYIRLPYMLEGIFIGIIGSIVPILIIYFGYGMAYESVSNFLPTMLTMREPFPFIWDCSKLLVLLGGGVGLIGSFLSVRRFLKF